MSEDLSEKLFPGGKTPHISDLKIPALDGFELAGTLLQSTNSAPDSVVIMCGATGVKRQFYEQFATFLAQQGCAVVTFDYRGIGDSRPPSLNKFQAFMHEWGEKDIAGVIRWATETFPTARLFAVCHSVGGQVLGLAPNNNTLSGAVFVASQSGYWGHWPLLHQPAILILWYIMIPILSVLISYFPSRFLGLGENLPAGVALEWASWGRDSNYILGENQLTTKDNFRQFTAPLLAYSVPNDFFAPRKAVEALLDFYPNAPIEHKPIIPKELNLTSFGHFDFFKNRFGKQLWVETLDWLNLADKMRES